MKELVCESCGDVFQLGFNDSSEEKRCQACKAEPSEEETLETL
jgi:hypothetical protein